VRLGDHHRGAPVLVGLAPGESESYDAWADFLSDLTGRGLVPPLLVISDGAPGLIGACEVVLAKSVRQRCLIHRARNVLAKVPKSAQAEVKEEFWKIFDDIDAPAGQEAVDVARTRIAAFEKRYASEYPAAVKCMSTDVASLTVYLRFPTEHHKRIRQSEVVQPRPSELQCHGHEDRDANR
jgi:putative transposase